MRFKQTFRQELHHYARNPLANAEILAHRCERRDGSWIAHHPTKAKSGSDHLAERASLYDETAVIKAKQGRQALAGKPKLGVDVIFKYQEPVLLCQPNQLNAPLQGHFNAGRAVERG